MPALAQPLDTYCNDFMRKPSGSSQFYIGGHGSQETISNSNNLPQISKTRKCALKLFMNSDSAQSK